MRIGLFTHSTNPRGGVVHALEVADSLCRLHHRASLVAPADAGHGATLFRDGPAERILVPVRGSADLATSIAHRIADLRDRFAAGDPDRFDVWHAGDSITANALADLADMRVISGYVRTVHHLDDFADPRLDAWQRRGVERASLLLCVGAHVGDEIRSRFARRAECVGNGVDPRRFRPDPDPGRDPGPDRGDAAFLARIGIAPRDRPVFAAMGGIEARKNAVALLRAFLALRRDLPDARLVIAGGASLLDHGTAQREFAAVLRDGAAPGAVVLPGVLGDDEVAALYRRADALVQVSLAEGFGLCPVEAMACGTPVVVSDAPPFTAHFHRSECVWADPHDVASIASAMRRAVEPPVASLLASSGPETAARFSWDDVARRHLELYARLPRETEAIDA